jgi:hypothetical protein
MTYLYRASDIDEYRETRYRSFTKVFELPLLKRKIMGPCRVQIKKSGEQVCSGIFTVAGPIKSSKSDSPLRKYHP